MRILAALTLLISALLSPLSTAAPLELKWEFNLNQVLGGTAGHARIAQERRRHHE